MRQFMLGAAMLSLALLSSCNGNSNKLTLRYHPRLHKVIVNAHQGDVIEWDKETKGLDFGLGAPCALQQMQDKISCKVTEKYGHFPYTCTGCTDPEVGVGDDPILEETVKAAPDDTTPPIPIYMACYQSAITMVQYTPAHPNDAVDWEPGGLHPIGNDWMVTVKTANACKEGTTFKSGASVCHLQNQMSDVPFTVAATDCSPKDSSIKIMP